MKFCVFILDHLSYEHTCSVCICILDFGLTRVSSESERSFECVRM